MAYFTTIWCSECNKSVEVGTSPGHVPDMCGECKARKEKEALEKHLEFRRKFTLEQRIEAIEAVLFKQSRNPQPFNWNEQIG